MCSASGCTLAWAKKDLVYSATVRQGVALIMSGVAKDRVKGADLLAKLPYGELKDFDLGDLDCGEGEVCRSARKLQQHFGGVYHFIAAFKKHERAEMDPASKRFCQNSKLKSDFNFECPYPSKIRWLIFDQFVQTFANEKGPIKTQTLANQAFDELTKIAERQSQGSKACGNQKTNAL